LTLPDATGGDIVAHRNVIWILAVSFWLGTSVMMLRLGLDLGSVGFPQWIRVLCSAEAIAFWLWMMVWILTGVLEPHFSSTVRTRTDTILIATLIVLFSLFGVLLIAIAAVDVQRSSRGR